VTKINLDEEEPAAPASADTRKSSREDVVARLRELADLKEQGIISSEEFEEMKKKLIEGFGK